MSDRSRPLHADILKFRHIKLALISLADVSRFAMPIRVSLPSGKEVAASFGGVDSISDACDRILNALSLSDAFFVVTLLHGGRLLEHAMKFSDIPADSDLTVVVKSLVSDWYPAGQFHHLVWACPLVF